VAKIITIANQKGGVAKTTTAQALGAGLKDRGYKVLVVDADPQGNLSSSINAEVYNCPTIYDVMTKKTTVTDVIQELDAFDIVPANIIFAGIEHKLMIEPGREFRLDETVITPIANNYDYIIIDTPPTLGILTMNAVMAANEIIIPTTASIFAAAGIEQLKMFADSITPYRKRGELKYNGILITKFNPRTTVSKELKKFTEELSKMIGTKIYETYIRFSVAVEEAQVQKVDIFNYGKNNISDDYNLFVDEFLKGAINNVKK
jgi:chromosome partitioning protein